MTKGFDGICLRITHSSLSMASSSSSIPIPSAQNYLDVRPFSTLVSTCGSPLDLSPPDPNLESTSLELPLLLMFITKAAAVGGHMIWNPSNFLPSSSGDRNLSRSNTVSFHLREVILKANQIQRTEYWDTDDNTISKITLICRLQLGQTATSSPS